MPLQAIFVDAGHGLGPTGGIDNGASGNGTTERDQVVKIAGDLLGFLRADPDFSRLQSIPIGVDVRLSLITKINQINAICRQNGWQRQDAFVISIHLNAGDSSARGVEAWYSSQHPEDSSLALTFAQNVTDATGFPLRKPAALPSNQNRWGRLGILDDTLPRACLVECGFVTNEFDAALIQDPSLRPTIAQGLFTGLHASLTLQPTPIPQPQPQPVPTPAPIPAPTPPAFYTDVPAGTWYHDDVALVLREGLFRMSSDGLFHPDHPVTRAELAAVIARHLRTHHNIS